MNAYQDAGNEQALTIVSKLADWYLRWTDAMQKRNPHAVYSGEEGGMLEVWTRLYEITGNEKYKILAGRYSNPSLFGKLLDDKDGLTNCHANSSIPMSHGAARLYEVTGEEKWRTITENSGNVRSRTEECTAQEVRTLENSGYRLLCRDSLSAVTIRSSVPFITW